ncbi:MAG: hypothetical protein KDD41_04600 [Flavobacteriales bacterium]|nr:hypothetical protein [Flavobacteriales bacterium]
MAGTSNNLNTFRILFLVKGILALVFSLIFVLYAGIGVFVGELVEADSYGPPFNPGIIFIIVGAFGFIFTVALGVLALLVSKYIKERRNYTFIYVVALINALSGVLGILLAIFTLIELSKAEVKAEFSR